MFRSGLVRDVSVRRVVTTNCWSMPEWRVLPNAVENEGKSSGRIIE
jgi:hypothetical protein